MSSFFPFIKDILAAKAFHVRMASWGGSECPQTRGIPAGTRQSCSRHAVERISAWGQERENLFPPQDSGVLFVTARSRGKICRDACELFAFIEVGLA